MSFGPPVLIGERVAWLGSGSGVPQPATVRWIGSIPEITRGWTVGIELDRALPVGGIDGTWQKRQLFRCESKCGLLVPLDKIVKYSSILGLRHSIDAPTSDSKTGLFPPKTTFQESSTVEEFLQRVLPPKTEIRKSTSLDSGPSTAIDELEKLKENLKALEKLKLRTKRRVKKISRNPDSLYEEAQARRGSESDLELFQNLIGGQPKLGLPPLSPPVRRKRKREIFKEVICEIEEVIFEECGDFEESVTKEEALEKEEEDRVREEAVELQVEVLVGVAKEEEPGGSKHQHGPIMTSIPGRFRRIDEDYYFETEKRPYLETPPPRRKLFSFLKWFKKPKENPNFDFFNNVSVTSSPVLPPRNRCESLFSLATVSSFSFVPASQYHQGKKKRRAPQPPNSLPNTLQSENNKVHRRSASECYRNRASGAFCHVKKKRKAPQPPARQNIYPSLSSVKKKMAPQPPILCNDTLKLEKGVLKQNKPPSSSIPKIEPVPVSPKPWYKRKHSEKKKEKEVEDWMPEINFVRPQESGFFNFFTKITEKEEKRRSQVSILPNISELDREAAEIVRHSREINEEDRQNSTRELISLFNSISEAPRITINPRVVSTITEVSEPCSSIGNKNIWVCYKCTLENLNWKLTCDACGSQKPKKSEMDLIIDWEKELKKYFPEREAKIKENDLEELRKKRLAFFTKTETTSVRDAAAKKSLDDSEKLKLKGMLKELKNSVPKHVINNTKLNEKNNWDRGKLTDETDERDKINQNEFELIEAKDLKRVVEKSAHVYANVSDPQEEAQKLTTLQGLAAFKADLDPNDRSTSTLAINRLLKRLETAIADGERQQAASLARELAVLKINCCVTRQKPATISLDLYVEDKISHKGPISLQVHTKTTLAELKEKVEKDFQIPKKIQRWILGKRLANDENSKLEDYGVSADHLPVFLYLVAPAEEEEKGEEEEEEVREVTAKSLQQPASSDEKPNFGKGWYYNYEEDRYSYCETSDSEGSPEKGAPPSSEERRSSSGSERMVLQPAAEARSFDPLAYRIQNRSIKSVTPDKSGSSILRPRSRSIFDLIKPIQSETLKKDLKVISPNAVKETIEKLTRRSEDIRAGWKCSICTLINATNRNSCSACDTERPREYVIPAPRPVDEELKKLRRDLLEVDLFREEPKKSEKDTYLELMDLDSTDVVTNSEHFDCPICMVSYLPGEGVVLRDCLHTFCRPCLVKTVEFSEEAEVKCPYLDATYSCESVLQQREIKALVPQHIFEQHLAKSVTQAEHKIGNAFHCKTPDCTGWCIYEDNVNDFTCPVCRHTNCLTCQAIHEGKNCRVYQEELKNSSGSNNKEARRTKTMLEEMVQKGDAMACPTCQVVLMKKWGCDWLRCSMCKTEICWVTRGPRWGPGGKGDTSAGCQCGLNGVKCHPKCNYCH